MAARESSPLAAARPRSTLKRRRAICFTIASILVVLIFSALFSPLPTRYEEYRNLVFDDLKSHIPSSDPGLAHQSLYASHGTSESESERKNAYAIFLAANVVGDTAWEKEDIDMDVYYVSTRMLVYQLLHAPDTRTTHDYPVIVLVTPKVNPRKRERLEKDGAVVIEAEALDTGHMKSDIGIWQSVMMKFRLWQLTQYDRIAFVDADTVLRAPLDDIFTHPALRPLKPRHDNVNSLPDEGPLPTDYVFAGISELNRTHHYPPTEKAHDFDPNQDYLNAGFFVLQPSQAIFDYYMSLTHLKENDGDELMDHNMPEQSLLNYAHRMDGPMPWQRLGHTWSAHYPDMADVDGGVKSLHDKFWRPHNEDVGPILKKIRWKMEGFWEGRDQRKDETEKHVDEQ